MINYIKNMKKNVVFALFVGFLLPLSAICGNVYFENKCYRDTLSTKGAYSIIPKNILALLKTNLPDWKLLPPSYWNQTFYKQYKTANSLPCYFSSDLNGDGKSDYVFILTNNENKLAIWAMLSSSSGYFKTKLSDLTVFEKNPKVVINGLRPGLYHSKVHDSQDEEITVRYISVRYIYDGRADIGFYWNGSKFQSFYIKYE